MPLPERLTDEQKQALINEADGSIRIPFHFTETYWLAADWDESSKAIKPKLVTIIMFDNHEHLLLVSAYYKPKQYIPVDFDMEPERNIVTGSVDPKSGRVRIVVDPTRPPTPAAPIKSQVNWGNVKPFKAPNPDKVEDWSQSQDDDATNSLVREGLFRPESKSMAVRVEGLDQSIKYNPKFAPNAYVQARAKQCHERYPETEFERILSERFQYHCEFERIQSGSLILEWMRAASPNAKNSILRTLFETGKFDEFPFKVRATALLMSRGFTTKDAASEIFLDLVAGLSERSGKPETRWRAPDDVFESYRWVYSEEDFQRYRSIVEDIIVNIMAKSPVSTGEKFSDTPIYFREVWNRYQITWNKLSEKQQDAACLLCMKDQKSTFKRVAEQIGISVDSLKDRWHLIKRRFRKAFPEFRGLKPSKTYTKSKQGSYIYWGLYFHAAAQTIRVVTHTKYLEAGTQVTVSIPALYKGPKREETKEFKEWQSEHEFLEDAVTKLDEPFDFEARSAEVKFDAEATDNTSDLWDVFRPDKKRIRDLSIASPLEDDQSPLPDTNA